MTPELMKILIVIGMIVLAYQWSHKRLNKPLQQLRGFKQQYGIVTIILLIIWWVLTPSFSADDAITIAIINHIGIYSHTALTIILTAYLVWRLRITIIIGGKQ